MKEKIIVLLVAVALVVLMFHLPRVVVSNESELENGDEGMSSPQALANTSHSTLTDPAVIDQIDSVKRLWKIDDYSENNATFANYLADQYLTVARYDSAITYFEWLNEHFPGKGSKEKLAEAYYQAFGFEMDPASRKKLASKAKGLYEELLKGSPDNLSYQNKLAMTYMTSANPMQGIQMLQKIVERDPDNEEALLNLGILAFQTSQFDRAEEHLTKLVEYHPEHWQGHLLLGAAMLEHGHKNEARQHFEIVKNKGDDPALIEAAENYLKNI